MSLRMVLLRLAVLLFCRLHNVFAANITVMDTDPSIVYSPLESWHPSSELCLTCLDPGTSISFHEGIHPAISHDSDDVTSTSLPSTPTPGPPPVQISAPSNLAVVATPPPSASPSSSGDDSPGDDSSGKHKRNGSTAVRPRLDSDDPGFIDVPLTVSYNFTGTAIYMFCILPLGPPVNGTPTYMNLSFTLDNQPIRANFLSNRTSDPTGFQTNQNVLSLSNLTEGPHQLVVQVGDDSVFIFDHLIYVDNSTVSPVSVTTSPIVEATITISPQHKKNNVATFGGAIGGTVGVLSLFSLGIAISIIRRRSLAARRDRLDNEANDTSETPAMSGPLAFIPRFFPDTIIPPDPPTYNDALLTTNHNTTPMLSSLSTSDYHSRQRSYADIPPASPPPPLEEMPPPPPFPIAISAPIPVLPPGVIFTSISVEDRTSSSPDSVGNGASNFTTSPENAHSLQSDDSDTRPRSRLSTTSLEPPENENPEASHHQQEDGAS